MKDETIKLAKECGIAAPEYGVFVMHASALEAFYQASYEAGAESEKVARREAQEEQERLKGLLVKSNSERIQAYEQGQRDMREAAVENTARWDSEFALCIADEIRAMPIGEQK